MRGQSGVVDGIRATSMCNRAKASDVVKEEAATKLGTVPGDTSGLALAGDPNPSRLCV